LEHFARSVPDEVDRQHRVLVGAVGELGPSDDVRLTQIFGETGILATKLLDFFFPRIAFGLRPTFPWSQSLANSIGSLSPPISQQRRVQTFAAKQSADATWYGSSSLGLDQDALFVLRGIGAPFGFGNHLGIRRPDRPGAGARFGCRSTALRLASLTFAPFRARATEASVVDEPPQTGNADAGSATLELLPSLHGAIQSV
jgi:hypothetical protein